MAGHLPGHGFALTRFFSDSASLADGCSQFLRRFQSSLSCQIPWHGGGQGIAEKFGMRRDDALTSHLGCDLRQREGDLVCSHLLLELGFWELPSPSWWRAACTFGNGLNHPPG